VFDCGVEEETVTHLLHYCDKYNEARLYLNDTLEEKMVFIRD